MASKIRDLLVMFLPVEWGLVGIGRAAGTPGPPGVPTPHPPGPDLRSGRFEAQVDLLELRMVAQLLLARLGGPVTLGEMEPQSLSEIKELEARLAAAQAELKGMREQLERK